MTQSHRWHGWRQSVLLSVGLTLALATLAILVWTKAVWPQRFLWAQVSGEAVFCVQTQDTAMALTFDDGPHPIYTPAILEILEEYSAKATFFAIGRHLQQHPQVAQMVVAQGHELANHTFSHPDLNRRLGPGIEQEIQRMEDLLTSMIDSRPSYFRPPYGHANLLVMQTLKAMGRPFFFWDIDLLDWSGLSVDQMMAMLAEKAHPGGIVLMHDSSPHPDGFPRTSRQKTVELVRQILATYTAQGYQFVTLSDLLSRGEAQSSVTRCQ